MLWANPALRFFSVLVLCSLAMLVITSIGVFRVLGEAERYLEYSSPMLVVVAVVYCLVSASVSLSIVLPMIVTQLSIVFFIHLFASSNRLKKLLHFQHAALDEFTGVVDFLKQLPGEVRVATLPIKLPRLLSIHTDGHNAGRIKYYYRFIVDRDAEIDGFKRFDEETTNADVFAGHPRVLKEKYGIEYVVADRGFVETVEHSEFVKSLVQSGPIFRSDRYDYGQFGSRNVRYVADSNMRYTVKELLGIVGTVDVALQLALAPMQWIPGCENIVEVLGEVTSRNRLRWRRRRRPTESFSEPGPADLPASSIRSCVAWSPRRRRSSN